MTKIKKCDIKNNSYYFKIIMFYTIVIAIVYGSLCYIKLNRAKSPYTVSLTLIVVGSIFILGAVIEFLFLLSKARKRIAEETNENEKK